MFVLYESGFQYALAFSADAAYSFADCSTHVQGGLEIDQAQQQHFESHGLWQPELPPG